MASARESVSTTPHSASHLRVTIDRLRRRSNSTGGIVAPGDWITSGTVAAQDALYASSAGVVSPADASAIGTGRVVGFAAAAAASGDPLVVQTTGMMDGFTGLIFNTIYYLDVVAGGITVTAPTAVGEVVTVVGVAASATELVILITPPILL